MALSDGLDRKGAEHLAAIVSGMTSLAGEQPEKVKELAAEWQRWANRVGVVVEQG